LKGECASIITPSPGSLKSNRENKTAPNLFLGREKVGLSITYTTFLDDT
jgi:hypothetical protein